MEKQQNKIFANCSQTVRNHCEFRNVLATSFALRNSIAPIHCTFAKFASHKTLAKFRIAKIRNVLATLANFAMPISQCEFRNANFAMPISQGQFRNSNFARPIHCSFVSHKTLAKFRIAKFANHFAKFANPLPNSQTTLPTSPALRNSHLRALSSSVINATDFQTW